MATVDMPLGPLLTGGTLSGHIHDDTGNVPTNVIRTEDPWSIHLDWNINGPIIPFLTGEWRVEVAFERVGPGQELLRTEAPIPYASGTFGPTSVSYNRFVSFSPGYPPLAGGPDAAYHVVVMLTFRNGATPGPFATVLDLGIVQFYDSPKP